MKEFYFIVIIKQKKTKFGYMLLHWKILKKIWIQSKLKKDLERILQTGKMKTTNI